MTRYLIVMLTLLFSFPAHAVVYAFTNEDGDYVVSQKKPADPNVSYAILTEEGEFVRMVEGRDKRVPLSHWRPFFLPKEPHPLDGPDRPAERRPDVQIDEVRTDD